MKIRSGIPIVAACVVLGLIGTARGDISVSFAPSDTIVDVGEMFTVDILADIPAADAIVGFGMDALFDGLILGHDPLTDVSIGPSFDPAPTLDSDGLAGTLPFAFPPLPPVSGSDVLLAIMTFEALDLGSTSLLGDYTLGDPFEGFALFGGGFADVSFAGASVSVVPAPAAAMLGLLGFALVPLVKRRLDARSDV